jgi:hypothetical protein
LSFFVKTTLVLAPERFAEIVISALPRLRAAVIGIRIAKSASNPTRIAT